MEESKDFHLLHSPQDQVSSIHECVELKFSVPWGHIAAKAWGDQQGDPILAVHGMHDNAATFDTLIPLLLQSVGRPLYIVSIDLPGHGHSSEFAPGMPYRYTDLLGCLRRVVVQLNWNRFHLLGHSLGGLLGYYFAASYPELVDKLIVIDAIVFRMYPPHFQINMLRALGDRFLEMEKRETSPPAYTLEQALQKLSESRGTKMTKAGIQALASRNLKSVEGRENLYRFSRDQRIKYLNFPLFYEQEAVHIMSQVKCKLLVLTGNESQRTSRNSVNETVMNAVSKNCSYFKHVMVEGDHDVHLNFPERIAPVVSKFLCEPLSSL